MCFFIWKASLIRREKTIAAIQTNIHTDWNKISRYWNKTTRFSTKNYEGLYAITCSIHFSPYFYKMSNFRIQMLLNQIQFNILGLTYFEMSLWVSYRLHNKSLFFYTFSLTYCLLNQMYKTSSIESFPQYSNQTVLSPSECERGEIRMWCLTQ